MDTGKITAQYHVVVDDWFQTVDATTSNDIDFDHDDWYKTFGLSPRQYIPDDSDDVMEDLTPVGDSEGAQQAREEQARVEHLADEMAICTGDLQYRYSSFIAKGGASKGQFRINLKDVGGAGASFMPEMEN